MRRNFRSARTPKKSLRTILVVWFLFFSLVPVGFLAGYSMQKYQDAIDDELVERLRGVIQAVTITLEEYQKYLVGHLMRYESDPVLVSHLTANNISQVRAIIRPVIINGVSASLSVFNREGRLVNVISKDEKADAKENAALDSQNLYLADNYRQVLDQKDRIFVLNPGAEGTMEFVGMARLRTPTGRTAGYVEEIMTLGNTFMQNLKKRHSVEIILFDSEGNIGAGSHPDFMLYKKDMFRKTLENETEVYTELPVRNISTSEQNAYGMIIKSITLGESPFYLGLAVSKEKAKGVVRDINRATLSVIAVIVFLVLILAVFSSRVLLRPLSDLLHAIQVMETRGDAVEVPVTSDNELGVLTDSFNEMSRGVRQARAELEKKIKELERSNADLKDAQAKLVHSSKMVSLGQLVAGVAHELNNPIGFIYSNMTHLRDYSNRLLKIIEEAEKNPGSVPSLKSQNDYEYIVKDLPRLIQSCEDGSRRVRDIVLGLRNFSRLEEAKIKRVDLKEGIEQTLQLLSGELKGRIKVHTKFADMPQILCYASQLNQVFMNILSNAAQAIEGEGEIWVTTKVIPPKHGEKNKGRAQVQIRDSGKGMAPEILDKIFDPFFTTKSLGQGTGLGLSISYGIIKKHAGDITVKSEPGKGTEFTIVLPIDGPPGAESQAAV